MTDEEAMKLWKDALSACDAADYHKDPDVHQENIDYAAARVLQQAFAQRDARIAELEGRLAGAKEAIRIAADLKRKMRSQKPKRGPIMVIGGRDVG